MEIATGKILLFKNATKKTDKHPDMRGETRIKCPHCHKETDYQVVLWGKETKSGAPMLSGNVNEHTEQYAKQRSEDNDYVRQQRYSPKPSSEKDEPF